MANAESIGIWLGLRLADWRLTFVMMAVPGFVLAGMLLMREPQRGAAVARADRPIDAVLDHIRRAPELVAALILGTAMLQLIRTVMSS